jgi:TonB family protein
MRLGWVAAALACGLVLAGLTGCVPQKPTVVTPIHIPQPPALGPGTGADDDPFVKFGEIKGVTPPVVVYSPEAKFSDKARRKKEACALTISLTVTKEGTVRDMLLVNSCPDLDANALKAVGTYRFTPAMKDGQPVAVRIRIEVGFTIY